MTPGRLNRLVTVKKWADTPDAFADVTQVFDIGVERWASMAPVAGAMYWGTKQTGEDVTHRFFMRWARAWTHASITGEHVIEFDNIRYRVKRASDWKDQRRYIMVEAKELGAIA